MFVTSRKRFIIITRFLIAVIVGVLAGREAAPEHLKIVYPILLVYLLSNLFFVFRPEKEFNTERTSGWIFVFDTFFVSVFVFYLRAPTTEFYLVYFLTIFIAASAKSASAAIGTSLITAAIYGLLTKYGKTGIALNSVSFFMRTIFFFVTAMVVGYLAEQVNKERQAREAAQRMLHLSNRLATLFDVSKKMVSMADLDQLTRQLFDSAVQVLDGSSGSLMLLDEEDGVLTLKESAGLSPEADGARVRLGEGVAGVVAREGKAALLQGDISGDRRYKTVIKGRQVSSSVCAPLKIGDKVLGVLNVNRDGKRPPFADADLQLLVALANHAATVLEKEKLHERLAEAYDASRLRYETLVNTANAMIFATDAAGVITFINKQGAQMLGRRPPGIKGKPIFDFLHPDDRRQLKNALDNVTQKRKPVAHVQYRISTATGAWRQHSAACAPLKDKAKGECGLLGVAEDITDYLALQKRLAQSAKLATVGTMVSGIAHELNNPLVGVIGFAEILKERDDIRQSAGAELDLILQQAHRCVQTVRGLLRFARQEGAEKTPVDVNRILKESLDLTGHDLRARNISLVEEYCENLPATAADPSQIQQVFLNILSNAADAMSTTHDKGVLSLRTAHADGMISIEFADDGGGIKDMEKVFDPFYTTKEVGKGTGLGLSISYGIMEEHGGHIEARNSEEGAVFTVRLPVVQSEAETSLELPEEEPAVRQASILVIDDEEFILRICRETLERMGHTVKTAQSVDEVVRTLNGDRYDLVLTDIRMPGAMDGRMFYQWARENRPDIAGRIMFTTGDTVSPEIRKFLRMTGAECLTKPFHVEAFRKIIQKALDQSADPRGLTMSARKPSLAEMV